MKIQPIDFRTTPEDAARLELVKPPVVKSRLKRLFERPFTNVLRSSAAAEKAAAGTSLAEPPQHFSKDGFGIAGGGGGGGGEFEPSSVCLAKMVQNFIEDEKQSAATRCSRNRCNCFNGSCNDSSDDELELFGGFGDSNVAPSGESCELLKGLVSCQSLTERNLLADTAKIVEKNKSCRRKDDICRTVVADSLLSLGYDASLCKSRWEKSPSYPAGEYDYIDAIVEGERLIIDVDFRSEFEIARPTKGYKAILQTLPYIFVGKSDRLRRIIAVVSEAAKQSLKKKGMHIPPWRKAEYVRAKWMSPYNRATPPPSDEKTGDLIETVENGPGRVGSDSADETESGGDPVFELSEGEAVVVKEWKPPELKPKRSQIGVKIVTGLASVMEDEPSKF